MTLLPAQPIGIFDSGVGGLTVLRAINAFLPQEQLLYLGDTARLPYGTKSSDTVTRYALQAAAKLVERGIKMLVVACNTATAAALPALREAFAPLPVIGVVEPGAAAAVRATRNGHIAVIATEGTIKGGAYQRAIHALRSDARITGQPCTLFVPLAEEGWTQGPLVEGIAARYLQHIFGLRTGEGAEAQTDSLTPVRADTPDTLLLGCTHFPLLASALQNVVGPHVCLVDSAATTAEAVHAELQRRRLLATTTRPADASLPCLFLTTDDTDRFVRVGSVFLGRPVAENCVERVDL